MILKAKTRPRSKTDDKSDAKSDSKSKPAAPKKAATGSKVEKVREPVAAAEYETVNAAPEKKKKGWWSKFKD